MSNDKTLEEIFNGIVLSKVSSDNDRADAKRLSMEIGDAENTYSRVLISDEALTDDGRAAVKALFNTWILVNAGLEKWQYDDRNKATYNFSVMQARRFEGVSAQEYPLISSLAKQLVGIHRTLQQNLMRTLYRYFSNKGEKLEAINFPMI